MQPPWNASFIHRQTMANQVRFTTVELAELDARIAQAADRAQAIEVETFEAFRRAACESGRRRSRRRRGRSAALDVAAALAEWAAEVDAVRPIVDDSLAFEADVRPPSGGRGGGQARGARPSPQRLPSSTAAARAARGWPSSPARTWPVSRPSCARTRCSPSSPRPEASCRPSGSRLGVVDRLFSRVGAGDDLARGRSTFMAEMVETAAILTQATPRAWSSSTRSGAAPPPMTAWRSPGPALEALHDQSTAAARLFATHYHELAKLETRLGGLRQPVDEGQGVERRGWCFLHEAGAPAPPTAPTACRWPSSAGVPAGVVAPGRARCWTSWRARASARRRGCDDLPLFAGAPARPAPDCRRQAVAGG